MLLSSCWSRASYPGFRAIARFAVGFARTVRAIAVRIHNGKQTRVCASGDGASMRVSLHIRGGFGPISREITLWRNG